jgi:putative ABC transport system permease protein
LAKGFGVKVGDSLTLNVLGRDIEAKIASLREIDWRSLRFDFAIIFAPGTLEKAPHSHIAAVQAEASAEDAVERAATAGFPNVSSIRVREALGEAARMLDGIGSAVRGIAGVAIIAGVLVLAGAIATDQRKRVFDAVVFKVLGARRRVILGAFLLEYGLLGLITGVIAALAGTLVAWAVVVFLMDMGWTFLPGVAIGTVLAAIVVTVALGFAGTWRALGQKAAPHLRNR